MKTTVNNNGFTLAEMVVSVALSAVLLAMVFGFFDLSNIVYSTGTAGQAFQDGVNIVLNKVIEGTTEPTGTYGLAQGVYYCIGSGSGCATASINELHYWALDGLERWWKLDNTSTQLIFHHPTSAGTMDEVVYTAPKGSTITLRFTVPSVANYAAAVVAIDAILSQTVKGRNVSGAASTIVNLRNHPV